MSRVRAGNVILAPSTALVVCIYMSIKGLSFKTTSRGRLGVRLCIRTINGDPFCSKLFKSPRFDGRDYSKSRCMVGHVSILWTEKTWRDGWLGCWDKRGEEAEGWLAGDGCTRANPGGRGARIGIRSTFPSRLFSRSRISTRDWSFLVGGSSLYLQSSFNLWHKPHFGRCSSHFCFLERQVSQAFNSNGQPGS